MLFTNLPMSIQRTWRPVQDVCVWVTSAQISATIPLLTWCSPSLACTTLKSLRWRVCNTVVMCRSFCWACSGNLILLYFCRCSAMLSALMTAPTSELKSWQRLITSSTSHRWVFVSRAYSRYIIFLLLSGGMFRFHHVSCLHRSPVMEKQQTGSIKMESTSWSTWMVILKEHAMSCSLCAQHPFRLAFQSSAYRMSSVFILLR